MRLSGRSRYSIMSPSQQMDEITGEVYPDILSADYGSFQFSQLPSKIQLDDKAITRPFRVPRAYYNTYYGEDILLDLNLIPHISQLKVGDSFYVPSYEDFRDFVSAGMRARSSWRR